MEKFIRKGILFALLCFSAIVILGSAVEAKEQVFSSDASGNVFGAGQSVDISSQGISLVDNELFSAGMDVRANDVDVDGSAFLAGNNVTVNGANIGGSLFAAGSNVTIDAAVRNNIWTAGSTIITSADTSVRGIHAAGANVIVKGHYEAAYVSGGTVTFDAVVDGDVEIEAEEVIFGENASVGGKLTISSQTDPEGAEAIAETYEFNEVKDEEKDEASSDDSAFSVGKKAGKLAFGAIVLKKVKKMFLNLFRYALLALVFAVVLKKNLSDSYEMATKKAAPFWGFGALALICFPIFAIILCVTVIGLPLAGITTTLYILAICVSKVFTFSSLVRELIFTHTSKRLHPIAETVLSVLPAAVIGIIPVIGGLMGFACAIYTMGYIVMSVAGVISENFGKKEEATVETEQ